MLGNQFIPSSSREDRRFQNTCEDSPYELQHRFPPVHALVTPLHDEHLRQDQLHAKTRVHHQSPNAPAVIFTATTSSAATDRAPAALAVPQPPPLEARFCPPGSGEPRVSTGFEAQSWPPVSGEPRSTFAAPHVAQQREQPNHHSAAGGRGSSNDPPVGPVADRAADDGHETSAFYRKATYHRAAPGSAPSPLVLTELPIEPFDGDIRRYPMFRNRFLEIVEGHPDLAPRHKLQYLLQFLRGEPYELANNFQLTDANYYEVAELLEENYGDEYRLRQLLAKDFFAMRPPAGGVADLRRFYGTAFRITTELRTLGENLDGHVFYTEILMAKLPAELKKEIVRNSEYCRERTVTSILDGLREYARVLDAVHNSGIEFRLSDFVIPDAPCQERQHSPSARSPSECSSEESSECSEDTSTEQPIACVATAAIRRSTEERWRCQLCGLPHVADNCTTYATVTQRVRRIQQLVLCLYCLSEEHRVDSCPQKGLDLCPICHDGRHHRAVCRTAANGTVSRPFRRSSKCAKRGSSIVRKRSVPKRHVRRACEERPVTSSVAAARNLRRSGTQRRPTQIVDNPNKRHAPVKKAVHRSDSRRSKSTAPKPVPSSALRQDRENKPRAWPRTQGPSGDGNSMNIYRKKRSGNAGTSSKGRGSTTRPSTTSTDESKQMGVNAYDVDRILSGLQALLATASCSTHNDLPTVDRAQDRAGSSKSSPLDWDPFGDEPWDEDKSSTASTGSCSDAPSEPSNATSEDSSRFPTYKEVRAYVASASTNDAHAPLHECLEVTAVNPVSGATRKAIVFFDSGSDFSYTAPTLVRDLDLPLHGKCVLRVNTFGSPAPTTVEGFSTSVVLCSPQGRQVSLGATTADLAIPSVRTALVEDSDLPMLRRNERHLLPTQVTPDILIGQDRIQLFGRQPGLRLSSGYDVVHTILGPTVGGAAQVVTTSSKAVSSSIVTSAAEGSEQHFGSPRQQRPDNPDASSSQTVASPPNAPSNHQPLHHQALNLPPWQQMSAMTSTTEPPTQKPTSTCSGDEGTSVPPLKADYQRCLQNELLGDTTSTTLCAGRHPLSERMERSTLLQRTPNPLDTAGPLQSGLHTTNAVLHPELHLGHRRSPKCDHQQDHALRVSTEQASAPVTATKFTSSVKGPTPDYGRREPSVDHQQQMTSRQELFHVLQQTPLVQLRQNFDPPTHPVEAAQHVRDAEPTSTATRARASTVSPDVLRQPPPSVVLVSDHRAMEDEITTYGAPPERSDHGTVADSTWDCHLHHPPVTGKGTHSIHCATTTTASDSTRPSTVRPALLAEDGAAAEAVIVPTTTSTTTAAESTRPSTVRPALLAEDGAAAEALVVPTTTTTKTRPGASQPAPLAEDSIAAEAASTSLIPDHQQISRFRLAILATSGPTATDATGSVDTVRRPLAKNIADMLTVLHGHTIFQELLSGLAMHLPDAGNYSTECHAAATPTLAQPAVGPAARADPLDQEENTTIFAPTPATYQDCEPDPANIHDSTRCKLAEAPASANQTTMARRLPAEAAQHRTTFSAARHATPGDPTTVRQPPDAHRAPAEAALHRAAPLQDDVIRDRRINRDNSPPKNETVCFCDDSTFLYFGRLLRPEILMIPIPVPSFEDALQGVPDLHLTKEVSRVIFWFSDSHATPLSTAVQLRLAVELSRHYATRYPTVMQFVVATPSISSRQDVWTYGLFKLLVQMQATLAYARVITRPRGSRSVTHADVVALKRYLRDHHHLNLWSCYDADVPRAVDTSYSKPQQRRAMQSPISADHSATEASAAAQTRTQRRILLKPAKDKPKDGTIDAATQAGPACPPGKTGSRQRDGMRDGSAAQPVIQFPPPPSRSRFHSTPLSALLGTGSPRTSCLTSQVDLAQERKLKPRSRSKPTKSSSRGKKKEHTFRDEDHHCSKDKQTSAAPAFASKPPVKRQTSESRPDPLSAKGQAVAEAAEHQSSMRRAVCAFCALPHWATRCTVYRSTIQRFRRVRELGYCFTCLRAGHAAQACPSRTTSSCQLCKKGPHHWALCPLSSSTTSTKQTSPRLAPPSAATPERATTIRMPAQKATKKRRKPSRSAHSTDAPPAAPKPPTAEPTEAHHRRKTRKRKNREPRK